MIWGPHAGMKRAKQESMSLRSPTARFKGVRDPEVIDQSRQFVREADQERGWQIGMEGNSRHEAIGQAGQLKRRWRRQLRRVLKCLIADPARLSAGN